MATIQLKNNTVIAPFMGDRRSLSIGLNPLGIRTASEQLFTTLLPGLNVVTLRIRYYSFYCWVIKRFYETRKDEVSETLWRDFRAYIRMAEFLMACIHATSDNSGGVPGITEAVKVVNADTDVVDLRASALPDGNITGGYWKGSMGALGTYYLASMQEMGLVLPLEKDERLYNITPLSEDYISGTELAESFAESIGEKATLFEQYVKEGIVNKDELKALNKTFQSHTMESGRERDLLTKMLLQKDKPRAQMNSSLRKDTIRLFLKYIQTHENTRFSDLDFAHYIYELYHDGKERSTASAGWYAYYLNDNRQFEALNIFSEVLNRLQNSKASGGWEKIDEFAEKLAEESASEFKDGEVTLGELFDKWDEVEEPKGKIAYAFFILLDDYVQNKGYKDCQKVIKAFFHDVQHDAMEQFDNIETMLDMTIKDFMQKYIVENIIYRHYSEATRKFSQNGVPTQKLTLENGLVRGLSGFFASHSSPRIDTIRNFASDLMLIEDNKLIESGTNLLKQLEND